MKKPKYRSVDFSNTTITELMIPSYANFGGKIHGGLILSLMDKVAYACAAKHAGGYCVTVSMNAVDFLAPVEVGDLVHLHGSVNYVGTSSIVVGIKVMSENITTGEIRHTNTSYLTMVSLDENRKAQKVPGLILETNKGNIKYTATKIILNSKKEITIDKLTKGKRITEKEMSEMMNETMGNFKKNKRY